MVFATKPIATLTARFAKGLGYDGQDINAGLPHLLLSPTVTSKWAKGSGGPSGDECQNLIPTVCAFTAADARRTGTIHLHEQAPTLTSQTKRGGTEPCVLAFAQNQIGEVRTGEVFNTINTNSNASGRNTPLLAFPANMSATQCASTEGLACNLQSKNPTAVAIGTDCYNGTITGEVAATMGTPGSSVNASGPTVMQAMQVRRLTPIECERLQGFPDNYTNVPHRGKPAADGPRYKALGNSMAVPCMAWIGRRIQMVDQI